MGGAQTKRHITKRPQGQNVPRHKVPRTKRPKGQNIPGAKRPTLITKFSKANFVLENWPHVLGNGPPPCTPFMIGVFLF